MNRRAREVISTILLAGASLAAILLVSSLAASDMGPGHSWVLAEAVFFVVLMGLGLWLRMGQGKT